MGSPSEHYEEAERLLALAHMEKDGTSRSLILAEAQVHATLALSAPVGSSPGQAQAGSTAGTGEARSGMPGDSGPFQPRPYGSSTKPARPGGIRGPIIVESAPPAPSRPRPIQVSGSRPALPPDEQAVRPPAQPRSAGAAQARPDPGPATDDPPQPGDLGDQELRGPEQQKPGGFGPA